MYGKYNQIQNTLFNLDPKKAPMNVKILSTV